MVLSGALEGSGRLELIDGEIVEMTPIGTRHASRVDRLTRRFTKRLSESVVQVRIQGPVHMGCHSEPQPDVLLLMPREDSYEGRHPRPEEVLLVVEVADSSLEYDREVKGPLYRDEAVREYWIVNLVDDVLEVYRQASPGLPGEALRRRRGERIAPLAFPDLEFTVDDLPG